MENMKPTKQHARKIIKLLSHGLSRGLGKPEPGKMCVEAAVCYALGLPHGDNPPCVSPIVRAFKITLNDAAWSSTTARATGLRRLAIVQLGSNVINDSIFIKELVRLTIRKILPIALRSAADIHPHEMHTSALESAAQKCENSEDANAASAASYAANAASYAASYAADAVLNIMAEIGVKALQLVNSPGCKWLDLTPLDITGPRSHI